MKIFQKNKRTEDTHKVNYRKFFKKMYLDMTNLMGGDFVVHRITVEGKRYFKEMLL